MRETLDNATELEEVSLAQLRADTSDPFLRWSVPDAGLLGAWRVGASLAVARTRSSRMTRPAPWVLMLGERAELAEIVESLPQLLGETPGGVTVSAAAYPLVPADDWGLRVRGRWDYMVTGVPPAVPEDVVVQEVNDTAAINELLDAGNADAHVRPGDPSIACWLGAHDDLGLTCVGALTVTDNGGAHLRAITTAHRARRQGLGWAVSAALTVRGLRDVSPEVTLGVYSDNLAAIALYSRLGYARVHRLVSAATPTPPPPTATCQTPVGP
jgi:ribosomal protein S18 acetylase RimI-like enzyme